MFLITKWKLQTQAMDECVARGDQGWNCVITLWVKYIHKATYATNIPWNRKKQIQYGLVPEYAEFFSRQYTFFVSLSRTSLCRNMNFPSYFSSSFRRSCFSFSCDIENHFECSEHKSAAPLRESDSQHSHGNL